MSQRLHLLVASNHLRSAILCLCRLEFPNGNARFSLGPKYEHLQVYVNIIYILQMALCQCMVNTFLYIMCLGFL